MEQPDEPQHDTAEGDIEIFFHNNSSGFIHNLHSGDGFIQRKAVSFGLLWFYYNNWQHVYQFAGGISGKKN